VYRNGAIYLNIRGLYLKSNKIKIKYLRDLAESSDSAMIILTETHLSPYILDAEISLGSNWIMYRADREGRTHGGCAVYVRRDLVNDLVTSHSNSYCDTLAVKVNTLETLIIVNYRPPGSLFERFEEALEVSQEAIDTTMKGD
jgi:hypothetical protein